MPTANQPSVSQLAVRTRPNSALQAINRIIALVQLGRIQFLLGGVVLHLLGVFIALYEGFNISVSVLLWGQVAITATQLMTHYCNDYFDLEADRHNQTPTNWSGGSRVLVEEKVSPRAALVVALTLASVALSANLALSLFVVPGAGTFVLLATAQLLAWFYSAPPLRLHSRGLGELASTFVVTFLTPLTGYYLHAESLNWLPVLAALPLCCFQFAMLLAVHFPDADGDRMVNKQTLVVRFGPQKAALLYVGVVVLAYLSLPILMLAGLPPLAAAGIGLLAPLALWQLWRIAREDYANPKRWNHLAFYTIVLLMASSVAQLGAFILLLGI